MYHRFVLFVIAGFIFHAKAGAQCAYFQQEVNYRILVSLNDKDHSLAGLIDIDYTNHSRDTLTFIYMHLWPNAYRDQSSAFARQQLRTGSTRFYFAGEKSLGGFEGLQFQIDNQPVGYNTEKDNPDIAKIPLTKPLLPGGSVHIATPFTLKIPASFSRLGHVGQSYQFTQWFPKPAVYDCAGWHPIPYLNMGEFYSEFGKFDVTITLPDNYVVGATGVLQTEDEKAFLAKKVSETTAMIDQMTTDNQKADTFPPSSTTLKTITYHAERVHDFAWFADKRFRVQKSEVDFPSGRKVDTWVMFTRTEENLWKDAINYVDRSVRFYSDMLGEYPWPHATAVQSALSAGGGMEYPMITVIDLAGSARSLDEVITHEVGHNWLYGILAFNERDHPWMDEGINSYYEDRYMRTYYPPSKDQNVLPDFVMGGSDASLNELAYLYQSRRHIDQAPETTSDAFTNINYFLGAYGKPALIFRYLEHYLGMATFDRVMQAFYAEWHFKHPQPIDLRRHLETATGKDLSWLFDGLLYSNQHLDYKITGLKTRGDSILVTLRNIGKIAGPIPVVGLKDTFDVSTRWVEGFKGRQTVTLPMGEYSLIAIDPDRVTLDGYRKNNYFKTSGFLRGFEPFHIRWLPGPENDRHSELFAFPMLGWNNYDKTMIGLAVFNHSILARHFEWEAVPMYAAGSKDVVGLGRIQYHFYPNTDAFQRITIGAGLRSYHYDHNSRFGYDLKMMRFAPFLRVELGKQPASNFYQTIEWRTLFLNREEAQFDLVGEYTEKEWFTDVVHELSYSGENRRVLNPFLYRIAIEQQNYEDLGGDQRYLKASLEWANSFTYARKRSVDLRLFAGGFLHNSRREGGAIFPGAFNLVSRGFNDYRFDDFYLGRNDDKGIWAQQVNIADGGLKTVIESPYPLGRSNNFIIAINIKADLPKDLPLKLPIKPYFDLGYFDNAMPTGSKDTFQDQLLWSGGLMFDFFDGIAGIYFPIINSKNINDLNAERGNYFSRITFSIDLEKINPWRIAERLQF